MANLRVLFIGGSGIISSACSQLAVRARHRAVRCSTAATTQRCARSRPRPTVLHGDIRDPASAREALGDREFDAVVDWVAFTPEHVRADLDLFRGRTGQYVFISSASAYQTPPARLPVTESTPLRNPFWQYSRDKIACEDLLVAAYRDERLPGDDRAAVAHLRPDARPVRRRLDRRRPDAARQAGRRPRRRHVAVDADPPRGLRARLRPAARPPADDRRGVPHHLRRRADLEPDRRRPWPPRPASRPRIVHVPSDAIAAADAGVGRRAARRQGALDGVRQHQDAQRSCRATGRRSRSSRAPGRSWPGTTPTRRGSGSTRGSTR